jgi:ABC-2 type transport system ATP-binding protein
VHGSRSARNHLRALAATTGITARRVDEVIDEVGLTEVADQRAGRFSLGMGQRLGIAAALLGDPATIMLDEPVNGLDPEGIQWIRGLLRGLAAEGRTVLVSSHLMSEMALTADHLVVIGRGRLIRDVSIDALIAESSSASVRVRCPDAEVLRTLLLRPGVTVSSTRPGELKVVGLSTEEIGKAAAPYGLVLFELSEIRASLEEAFMELTRDAVEYRPTEVAAA